MDLIKSFLGRLYGPEDAGLDDGSDESDRAKYRRFLTEMRQQGRQLLRQCGPPAQWQGFLSTRGFPRAGFYDHTREEDGDCPVYACIAGKRLKHQYGIITKTYDGENINIHLMFFDDNGDKTRHGFIALADPTRSIRKLAPTSGPRPLWKKFELTYFKLVSKSEIVRALYVAQEPHGDPSGEPDPDILQDLYANPTCRERTINPYLIPNSVGPSRANRATWDRLADEALTPPETPPELPLKEQEKFLASLIEMKAPLKERLAVEKANRLHSLEYYYNVRGRDSRLSWRMGRNGIDALRRAAKHYIRETQ